MNGLTPLAANASLPAIAAGADGHRDLGGPVPADQRVRLLDAYRQHLLDADRAPRTLSEYRRALVAFWDFTGKQPGRVTERDLRRFLAKPAEGPAAKGPQLAEATRATYAHEIAAAYKWFSATRLLKRDPFAGMALPRHRLGPPRDLPLEAVEAIIGYLVAFPRVWLEAWLAYGCGLRVAELAGLMVEDCHLGTRPAVRVLGKGRQWRLVPLHPDVAAVLRLSLEGRPQVGPVLSHHARPGYALSRKTVGHELNAGIREALKAAREHDPTLPTEATAHQLRHSFATALAAEGVGERAIGLLMGHRDPKTTRRYTVGFSRDAHEAVKLLPVPRKRRPATHEGRRAGPGRPDPAGQA